MLAPAVASARALPTRSEWPPMSPRRDRPRMAPARRCRPDRFSTGAPVPERMQRAAASVLDVAPGMMKAQSGGGEVGHAPPTA